MGGWRLSWVFRAKLPEDVANFNHTVKERRKSRFDVWDRNLPWLYENKRCGTCCRAAWKRSAKNSGIKLRTCFWTRRMVEKLAWIYYWTIGEHCQYAPDRSSSESVSAGWDQITSTNGTLLSSFSQDAKSHKSLGSVHMQNAIIRIASRAWTTRFGFSGFRDFY